MNRGSAAVEFALVVPLLLLVLLGLVEVAVAARTQLVVLNAAREGARQAATSPDPAAAVRAARRALGEDAERARIRVRRPHVVGAPATVTVVLPHRVGGGLLGDVRVELRGEATMRVER